MFIKKISANGYELCFKGAFSLLIEMLVLLEEAERLTHLFSQLLHKQNKKLFKDIIKLLLHLKSFKIP